MKIKDLTLDNVKQIELTDTNKVKVTAWKNGFPYVVTLEGAWASEMKYSLFLWVMDCFIRVDCEQSNLLGDFWDETIQSPKYNPNFDSDNMSTRTFVFSCSKQDSFALERKFNVYSDTIEGACEEIQKIMFKIDGDIVYNTARDEAVFKFDNKRFVTGMIQSEARFARTKLITKLENLRNIVDGLSGEIEMLEESVRSESFCFNDLESFVDYTSKDDIDIFVKDLQTLLEDVDIGKIFS